jgi:hypothetical protein
MFVNRHRCRDAGRVRPAMPPPSALNVRIAVRLGLVSFLFFPVPVPFLSASFVYHQVFLDRPHPNRLHVLVIGETHR